jgi:dihydrofolate reductase
LQFLTRPSLAKATQRFKFHVSRFSAIREKQSGRPAVCAAHTIPDQPQFVFDWARQWQAAEKIVYSRTLVEPRSARTRVAREFDPDAVPRLKADAEHDISVDGPELAAKAIRAGLVDEFQMIVCPAVVGGGKRFFPDGVRLDLELLEERRFGNGVLILRYGVRGAARGLASGVKSSNLPVRPAIGTQT